MALRQASVGLFAATAIAALVTACGGGHATAPPQTAVAPTFTALPDSEAARYAALLEMVDSHRVDEALIKSGLGPKLASPLRAEAVRAAGEVRARGTASSLRVLLADKDTAVAASAAFALGLMADTPSVNLLAQATNTQPVYASFGNQNRGGGRGGPGGGGGQLPVRTDSNRLRNQQTRVAVLAAPLAREAAWALGELGEPARKDIERILVSGFSSSIILYAAAKLKPVPVALITQYVSPGNPAILKAAVYAISRNRAPAGARSLLFAYRARDAETRAWVARGLAYSAAGDSIGRYALPVLDTLAHDTMPIVRINALASLRGYGAKAKAPVLIALRDFEPNVRLAAAMSLDSTLADSPRSEWAHAYNEDTSFVFHSAVVASAARDGVILPVIDKDNPDRWQRSGDWRFRAAAARAGLSTSMERIVDLTLPLTRDPDPRVRTAAYAVFAEAAGQSVGGTTHPWRREYMLTALGDQDVGVRSTGIDGLEEIGTADDIGLIASAYKTAMADSSNAARLAAVRCLAAIWQRDSAHVSADGKAAVAALPAPDDAGLLDAARGVSLLAGWRPENGRPAPHPRDWYLRLVHEIVEPSLRGQAPQVQIKTARGTLVVELFGVDAPMTVDNFLTLAKNGYFDHLQFHRVVPAFVAQDGDPRGDGTGGPGYSIRDELNRRRYIRGTVGMALDGPNTGGSQYFISLGNNPHLDGHYTAFGFVVSGTDALDQLVQYDAIDSVSSLVRVVTP